MAPDDALHDAKCRTMSAFDDAIQEMLEVVSEKPKVGAQIISASHPPTSSVSRRPHRTATLDYLTARLESAKAARQQQPKSIDCAESLRQMRREYLYGLDHVHQLTDLEHAPDAILYGNFRHEEKPKEAQAAKTGADGQ